YDAIIDIHADITTNLSCAPGSDGVITIDVTSTAGDPTAFEYSDDNGASWQDENYFDGLEAGNYLFFARHKLTGCIVTTSATLLDPNTFTIDVDVVSNVDCYGSATGEISFSLIDATYPITNGFNWVIFNTSGTPTDTSDDVSIFNGVSPTTGPVGQGGLIAGSYRLVIVQEEFPECTNETAFTIMGPTEALLADATHTDITCVPGGDGSIEISASGGWGGYKYYVSTTSIADAADPINYIYNARTENLPAGDYEIWVIDQMGCFIQLPNIELTLPDSISATLQINDDNCAAFEGEIEVVGTAGGQGSNYTYQLIKDGTNVGSPQNTPVFSGLGAGSYGVSIQDQWGCVLLVGPVVLDGVMTAVTTVVDSIECDPTISGDIVGGQIRLNVMGGSGSYNFHVVYPD